MCNCAVLPKWLSNFRPPFQDPAWDRVLERFRHVAMRVCGVQQRFLLRRDPSDRIGVCDLSARIGGGSLWTRRNLISLDPLMLLGNSVLFSWKLNPFDSISTLAVLSSKPFFAIRHSEMRPMQWLLSNMISWYALWDRGRIRCIGNKTWLKHNYDGRKIANLDLNW